MVFVSLFNFWSYVTTILYLCIYHNCVVQFVAFVFIKAVTVIHRNPLFYPTVISLLIKPLRLSNEFGRDLQGPSFGGFLGRTAFKISISDSSTLGSNLISIPNTNHRSTINIFRLPWIYSALFFQKGDLTFRPLFKWNIFSVSNRLMF